MTFSNSPNRNIEVQRNTIDSPDRSIGDQWNTSEYILKLQIHQHSLLIRKVFSWHNSSIQVLFSGSSLDHHQRWIVTRSSSKLDHHWIIIIITASSILTKCCYLLVILIIGSSTEPSLFHAGCRPSLHVGLHFLQCLYSTMGGPTYHHVGKACPPLISDHGRNTSSIHVRMARPSLTSDHGRPILPPCQKGPALTYDHGRPNLPPC